VVARPGQRFLPVQGPRQPRSMPGAIEDERQRALQLLRRVPTNSEPGKDAHVPGWALAEQLTLVAHGPISGEFLCFSLPAQGGLGFKTLPSCHHPLFHDSLPFVVA